MKDRRTWCQLTEKEAERRVNANTCGNSSCWYCYGDSTNEY